MLYYIAYACGSEMFLCGYSHKNDTGSDYRKGYKTLAEAQDVMVGLAEKNPDRDWYILTPVSKAIPVARYKVVPVCQI